MSAARMDLRRLTFAHTAILSLIKAAVAGTVRHRDCGLCSNLDCGSWVVREFAPDWPGYSGDRSYPVLGGENDYYSATKWKGEQLEQRLSLLRYMLKRLRDLKRRAAKREARKAAAARVIARHQQARRDDALLMNLGAAL